MIEYKLYEISSIFGYATKKQLQRSLEGTRDLPSLRYINVSIVVVSKFQLHGR